MPQSLLSRTFMRPSLFHFLPWASIFFHHDRVVLGKTVHCLKDKSGATTYCQHITGGVEEGTTFLLKGRSGAGFSYTNLISGPMFLLHNLGLRAILKFKILSHADDEI